MGQMREGVGTVWSGVGGVDEGVYKWVEGGVDQSGWGGGGVGQMRE